MLLCNIFDRTGLLLFRPQADRGPRVRAVAVVAHAAYSRFVYLDAHS